MWVEKKHNHISRVPAGTQQKRAVYQSKIIPDRFRLPNFYALFFAYLVLFIIQYWQPLLSLIRSRPIRDERLFPNIFSTHILTHRDKVWICRVGIVQFYGLLMTTEVSVDGRLGWWRWGFGAMQLLGIFLTTEDTEAAQRARRISPSISLTVVT